MAVQERRRDSRGWLDVGWLVVLVVDEVWEEDAMGPRPARRVSCRPGADGADVEVDTWVCVVGCEAGGAMRRDCKMTVSY